MKDLGFGLVDQRTVVVVLVTALVSHLLLGFPFPIDTQSVLSLFIDLFLLTGYLYIVRTLIRLPFAVGIGFKGALLKDRYDFLSYKEHLSESIEKIERTIGWKLYEQTSRLWHFSIAFSDQNNWKGILGFIDRIGLILTTLLITYPPNGTLIMRSIGLIGLLAMLLIYVIGGSFSLLVEDAIKQAADIHTREHLESIEAARHPDIKIPAYPHSISIRDDRYDNIGG